MTTVDEMIYFQGRPDINTSLSTPLCKETGLTQCIQVQMIRHNLGLKCFSSYEKRLLFIIVRISYVYISLNSAATFYF